MQLRIRFAVSAFLALAAFGPAAAGERIVSQSGLVHGVFEHAGFSIVPAKDIPLAQYTRDRGPAQAFEILRPGQAPIRIGRLHASCSCLELSVERRAFDRGERALFVLRNVKPTVKGGATYSFFIQIVEPVKETLRYDVFVDSGESVLHPPPAPASEGQPPAKADPPRGEERPGAFSPGGPNPHAPRIPDRAPPPAFQF